MYTQTCNLHTKITSIKTFRGDFHLHCVWHFTQDCECPHQNAAVSYSSARLVEGLQQNDGVDGLYRYESREKFTIPRGVMRLTLRKIEKRRDIFRYEKKGKTEEEKKKEEITSDNSAIVIEPIRIIFLPRLIK